MATDAGFVDVKIVKMKQPWGAWFVVPNPWRFIDEATVLAGALRTLDRQELTITGQRTSD